MYESSTAVTKANMVSVGLSVCCVLFVLGAVIAGHPKVDMAAKYTDAITKCEKEGCVAGDMTKEQENPCCYKCIMREMKMLNEDGTPKLHPSMPNYEKVNNCCKNVQPTNDCTDYLEIKKCFNSAE